MIFGESVPSDNVCMLHIYIYIHAYIHKHHVYSVYIQRFSFHITGSFISLGATVTGCSSLRLVEPNDATQVFVGVVGLNFSAPRVDKDSVADVVWHSNEPEGGKETKGIRGQSNETQYPKRVSLVALVGMMMGRKGNSGCKWLRIPM